MENCQVKHQSLPHGIVTDPIPCLVTINHILLSFLSPHQALEDELSGRHAELMENCQVGEDLIKANHTGSSQIRERIDNVKDSWERLQELAAARKKRLQEALDMYQVGSQ